MAITKIHAIKGTVNKAINYVTNPEKTDGTLLVSGYNCEAMTAHLDFTITENLAKKIKGNYSNTGGADNKAYHLIQSFSKSDNVTPEMAHEIGEKLADEFLGGKYEYVIATHIDKGHIHNHIILNSVSFYDYKKLRTQPYKTAAKIRSISDRLCSEYDLSVIRDGGKLGYSYKEHMERKKNTSWKSEIRKRLNYLLTTENDYEAFKEKAAELGVEVNDSGKHIKYKFERQQRYSRGNKLSDDDRYLKDEIIKTLRRNKAIQNDIIDAIKNVVGNVNTYEEFLTAMKEQHGTKITSDKKGQLQYLIDDIDSSSVPEIALGQQYSQNYIMAMIATGKEFKHDSTQSNDIVEGFRDNFKSVVKEDVTEISIDEKFIEKVTVDGVLLNVPEEGSLKRVFIDNRNIDYVESTNNYKMSIASAFNFYYVQDELDPDVLESEQLKGNFIKGERIIRMMEFYNEVEPNRIDISNEDIISIGEKGVYLKFDALGIDRMFVESEHLHYDKLNGECRIDLFENWTYSIRSDDDERAFMKVKGNVLIKDLKDREVAVSDSLTRRLMYIERKGKVKQTKALAEAISLLSKTGVDSVEAIEDKIKDLKKTIRDVKENIKVIESKNIQYKDAAKYLVSYNKYLPIKVEYEKKNQLSKRSYKSKYESELLAFEFAEKNLTKLGVNNNVSSDKVIELMQNQSKKAESLMEEIKTIEKQIDRWTDAKLNIENVIDDREEKTASKDLKIEER